MPGVSHKAEFKHAVRALNIDTEYAIVKPNWVSIQDGQHTEAFAGFGSKYRDELIQFFTHALQTEGADPET